MDVILLEFSRFAHTSVKAVAIFAMDVTNTANKVGNSPVEVLTRQHNWLFAVYMALLVLGAIFTYLLFSSGNRLQKTVQAEANARIQEANERAGKAEENAAVAKERTAVAEERVAKAMKDVVLLQKSAADAKAAQQRVETELARQQERAAVAERALLQMKESLKNRTISNEQRSRLINFLRGELQGPVQVWWLASDSDSYPLALQILEVLKDAGWKDVTERMALSGTGVGLYIAVHDLKNPPNYAGLLQHAFNTVGIPLEAYSDPETPVGVVRIFIGHKAPVR